MISAALTRRSQELAADRVPFATATVVRVQHPTSVEPGSVALVLGDGTIEGFVGGVCAEQSVRAQSLQALETGEPVLLKILPDAVEGAVGPQGLEVASEDGVVTVQNPCLSGGAIEVFIEPAPPAPRVLVVGETPIAAATRRICGELGLEAVVVGVDGPEPQASDLAVVVAAHGRDELHSLRRGLEVGVPYIGLVASVKRGGGVIDELRADGVPEEQLASIDVPAGVEIGARTAPEIAVSILAKVVSVLRDPATARPRAAAGATSSAPAPAGLAVDPICGMTVAAVASTPSAVGPGGETVYFCCDGCRARYEEQREHAGAAG